MAEAARVRGYAYLAICDHTTGVRVVQGSTTVFAGRRLTSPR
jgi:hypothetical protein